MNTKHNEVKGKDLFGWIDYRPRKPRSLNKFKRSIPCTKDWKDKHGSWAVMKGIVKVTQDQ